MIPLLFTKVSLGTGLCLITLHLGNSRIHFPQWENESAGVRATCLHTVFIIIFLMVKSSGNDVFFSACLTWSYNLHSAPAFSKSLQTPLNLCIMKDNISQSYRNIFSNFTFLKGSTNVLCCSTHSRHRRAPLALGSECLSMHPAAHWLAALKCFKNRGNHGIKIN